MAHETGEVGTYLMKLGGTEAMNLDGGGSAMLDAKGAVNSPCDGVERKIDNALIVARKGQ